MTSNFRRQFKCSFMAAAFGLWLGADSRLRAQEVTFSASPADGQPAAVVNGQPVELSPEQMKAMAKRGRGGPPGAQPTPPGQPPATPEGEKKKEVALYAIHVFGTFPPLAASWRMTSLWSQTFIFDEPFVFPE